MSLLTSDLISHLLGYEAYSQRHCYRLEINFIQNRRIPALPSAESPQVDVNFRDDFNSDYAKWLHVLSN